MKSLEYLLMYSFLFARYCRVQKPITKLLGPNHHRAGNKIEIDITYKCNARCRSCNRSVWKAPSKDQITLKQIKKFVEESINKDLKWKEMRVLGGEPTLHPNIHEILDVLLNYNHKHSPETRIKVLTNGIGDTVNKVLSELPDEIIVDNSHKKLDHDRHVFFYNAPCDNLFYKYADYWNGCWIMEICGMGLTPYGYYPCAVAGSIDRVFGFNFGRKTFPSFDDPMKEEMRTFCKFCGHFDYKNIASPEISVFKKTNPQKEKVSPIWKEALEKYDMNKVTLTKY